MNSPASSRVTTSDPDARIRTLNAHLAFVPFGSMGLKRRVSRGWGVLPALMLPVALTACGSGGESAQSVRLRQAKPAVSSTTVLQPSTTTSAGVDPTTSSTARVDVPPTPSNAPRTANATGQVSQQTTPPTTTPPTTRAPTTTTTRLPSVSLEIYKSLLNTTLQTFRCTPPNCWWVGYRLKVDYGSPAVPSGSLWSMPMHIECWSLDHQQAYGTPFHQYDTSNFSSAGFNECAFGAYGTGNALWMIARDSRGRIIQSPTLR